MIRDDAPDVDLEDRCPDRENRQLFAAAVVAAAVDYRRPDSNCRHHRQRSAGAAAGAGDGGGGRRSDANVQHRVAGEGVAADDVGAPGGGGDDDDDVAVDVDVDVGDAAGGNAVVVWTATGNDPVRIYHPDRDLLDVVAVG